MKQSEAAAYLREKGIENARGEARMIFDALAKSPLSDLDPDSEDAGIDEKNLCDILCRRAAREPLQYLIGVAWFWRESYEVSPDCLIPRSDTETLVEYAVRHIPKNTRFLDLCTGSGCVAISTLASRPDLTAVAADLSEGALALARKNAARNGVADRLLLTTADALTYRPGALYSALLCNPPYIRRDVLPTLPDEVKAEPRMALDGGEDGLTFYRAIIGNLSYIIYKDGFAAFEIGYDQGAALCELSRDAGMTCRILRDLGGNDRVAVLRF